MRAFAKTAIAVAFVSAIVWFGHHLSFPKIPSGRIRALK